MFRRTIFILSILLSSQYLVAAEKISASESTDYLSLLVAEMNKGLEKISKNIDKKDKCFVNNSSGSKKTKSNSLESYIKITEATLLEDNLEISKLKSREIVRNIRKKKYKNIFSIQLRDTHGIGFIPQQKLRKEFYNKRKVSWSKINLESEVILEITVNRVDENSVTLDIKISSEFNGGDHKSYYERVTEEDINKLLKFIISIIEEYPSYDQIGESEIQITNGKNFSKAQIEAQFKFDFKRALFFKTSMASLYFLSGANVFLYSSGTIKYVSKVFQPIRDFQKLLDKK